MTEWVAIVWHNHLTRRLKPVIFFDKLKRRQKWQRQIAQYKLIISEFIYLFLLSHYLYPKFWFHNIIFF